MCCECKCIYETFCFFLFAVVKCRFSALDDLLNLDAGNINDAPMLTVECEFFYILYDLWNLDVSLAIRCRYLYSPEVTLDDPLNLGPNLQNFVR